MSETLAFLLTAGAAFLAFWYAGHGAVRRLVVAMEGSSEFGHGTSSRLRRTKGYAAFTTWLILGAMAGSYFADWGVHGDPAPPPTASSPAPRVVAHILSALGDD
jgi:hypothetical protein